VTFDISQLLFTKQFQYHLLVTSCSPGGCGSSVTTQHLIW